MLTFFVIKIHNKLEAKKKSACITFWTILFCAFTPNIGKNAWTLGELIQFEEVLTDAQTGDGRLGIRYSPLTMSAADLKNGGKFDVSIYQCRLLAILVMFDFLLEHVLGILRPTKCVCVFIKCESYDLLDNVRGHFWLL